MTAKEISHKPRNERARFGFTGPADVLGKLRYDLERLESSGRESRSHVFVYAAMDCAVTIVALKDWINKRCVEYNLPDMSLETGVPHFQIARELANGFKHFTVDRNPKIGGFASGSVHLMSPGGEHVQFAWCGWDGETFTVLPMFREIAECLENIIAQLP